MSGGNIQHSTFNAHWLFEVWELRIEIRDSTNGLILTKWQWGIALGRDRQMDLPCKGNPTLRFTAEARRDSGSHREPSAPPRLRGEPDTCPPAVVRHGGTKEGHFAPDTLKNPHFARIHMPFRAFKGYAEETFAIFV